MFSFFFSSQIFVWMIGLSHFPFPLYGSTILDLAHPFHFLRQAEMGIFAAEAYAHPFLFFFLLCSPPERL